MLKSTKRLYGNFSGYRNSAEFGLIDAARGTWDRVTGKRGMKEADTAAGEYLARQDNPMSGRSAATEVRRNERIGQRVTNALDRFDNEVVPRVARARNLVGKHLRKHGGKYAAGAGLVGLAAGGYGMYRRNKRNKRSGGVRGALSRLTGRRNRR